MKLILIVILACISLGSGEKEQAKVPASQGDAKLRTNLFKSIFENYERGVNPDDPNVRFGISLISVDLNDEESTLESNVWLRFNWHDSRVAWDKKVFPIDNLRVELGNLWHPDVTLYNAADLFSHSVSCVETNTIIYSTGEVLWVPPCQLRSICKTTLKLHPYSEQTCPIKFGSWTYDSYTMDVNFFNNETSINFNDFHDLSQWKVLSATGVKNTRLYPCCPEPYTDLTYNVTLRRKPEVESLCEK